MWNGNRRLVLASSSPRRRTLIAAFAPSVEAISPTGEEGPPRAGEPAEEFVQRLSLAKAEQVAKTARGSIVLGADTAVVLDDQIIGKPGSAWEATAILGRLRGRTHRVVTGVTALDVESGRRLTSATTSKVAMRRYSDAEVSAYVGSGEPFDKAGAYAVQDALFHPAEGVAGCYLNVVGLPLCQVASLLRRLGAAVQTRPGWQPPVQCVDCPLRGKSEVSPP